MPKVTENYNLQVVNPELAKEWHPTKNAKLTPKDFTPKSNKKVWWLCKEKGHEWEATVDKRNLGRRCPCCYGTKVCEDNNLLIVNPALAAEWHPTKNGTLTPKDVRPKSNKKVWWLCKEKGHEWEAWISNRHNREDSCPYCSRQM